jgi:RimJ/RimL family protein N-acetyltransferase
MIRTLTSKDFNTVSELFRGIEFNLEIPSIIAGDTRGDIYVDNLSSPNSAMIWDRLNNVFLSGDALDEQFAQSIYHRITSTFIPQIANRKMEYMTIYYGNPSWEDTIERMLSKQNLHKISRRFFTVNELIFDWKNKVPNGYLMTRIDNEFLRQSSMNNINHVISWIESFWYSTQDFINNGIGFCILNQDTVTSWCLSVFVSGKLMEFGTETILDYRNKGFSTLVASACVDHCFRNQITPLWHCWSDNKPSIAVAEKIGFEKTKEYCVYRIEIS